MNTILYGYLRGVAAIWRWFCQRLTPIGRSVVLGWGLSGLIGLGTTESLCHLLFVFTSILLLLASVACWFLPYHFTAVRTLPRFGRVGEPLQYPVLLKNLTPKPQWDLTLQEMGLSQYPSLRMFLRFRRQHALDRTWRRAWRRAVAQQQAARANPTLLPMLPAHKKTKVIAEITPLRRGRLTLETLTLSCPDPLGLLYQSQSDNQPQSLCILPRHYHLPLLRLPSLKRKQLGDIALAASVGESLEFRSLRDYQPGDPMNKIHWKSWAKVGRPIVKEQQDDSTRRYGLVLDSFTTEVVSDAFEEMLAIAISVLTQDCTDASHLDVIYATPDARCTTVGQGLKQRAHLLETLATLSPCPDQTLDHLAPLLQTRLPRLSACLCILIEADPIRYDFLERLVQQGIPTTVILLQDPAVTDTAFGYHLAPLCRIHPVSLGQVQQDLLRL